MHVGALPPQLAALIGLTVAVEEMAVEAAITGNARLVYQAICLDPLSAAVLSLEEIKDMTRQLFAASARELPQFKHVEI
jgi:alpha-galactosidase